MARSNSQIFTLVFLGMLTAFGPFVTDMYLPTLPAMTDFFHANSSQVQLGLTASMIGLAVGQLLFGPISDKYGRRLPLIAAMCLFLLSTLGCIYSGTVMRFAGWRLIQGIAGAGGIVISRSIATDKYSGRELAKMLAVIGAINGVAPVAAPIAGGAMAAQRGAGRGFSGLCLGWGFCWFSEACILMSHCLRCTVRIPAGPMYIKASRQSFRTADTSATFFSSVLHKECCSPILHRLPSSCSSIMAFLRWHSASVLESMLSQLCCPQLPPSSSTIRNRLYTEAA